MNQFITSHFTVEYHRRVQFAIALIDPLTLEPVYRGVQVIADGLNREPIVNHSGLFVFVQPPVAPGNNPTEDFDKLTELRIEPGLRPYQPLVLKPSELADPTQSKPLTTIELSPLSSYPFPSNATVLFVRIDESAGPQPQAVTDAYVGFEWLDVDGNWQPPTSVTRTSHTGAATMVLRLLPGHQPRVVDGALTVRLRVTRGATVRRSTDFPLTSSKVDYVVQSFFWQSLQP